MHMKDVFNPDLKQNDMIMGYKVIRREALTEINAVYYELEHIKTKATHIHISMDDNENAFSVAFKTVPADSTGVAHILEHTALCGSERYSVRDPFFSMIKRSLNTFMNAFTAPDWTMYPFATQNKQDFYNLLSVYLDAAFFPKLDELSFKQEGHRVEFNDEGALEFKGVVYNEMKGAMSSPDQIMSKALMESMYPTTTYHFNSGGEPVDIPKLTYEGLLNFHRTHYHPSNTMFFTYGNFPLQKHLEVIETHVLNRFDYDPAAAQIEVMLEPNWISSKNFKYYYAFDKNGLTSAKSQVTLAWRTADITNPRAMLIMEILEQILLGTGMPLRKALMDSKLGSALSDGSGFESDLRQGLFSCGLKDTNVGNLPEIKRIITDTITGMVQNGIPWDLVEIAIHQIEFHRREISNATYPFGLRLCLWLASCVLHGGDAVKAIQVKEEIAAIVREAKEDRLLERSLEQYLLNNSNCGVITLEPDPEINAAFEAAEKAVLQTMLANLSDAEIARIKADSATLEILQNTEEDLSALPALTKNDIPVPVPVMYKDDFDYKSNAAFYYQNTSEITYITTVAGLQNVDPTLYPLLPFFGLSFTKMGTRGKSHEEMARALNKYTGATSASVSVYNDMRYDENPLPLLVLDTKALLRNQDNMFELLDELLHEQTFADLSRLEILLKEYHAALEAGILRNGHAMAIALSARGLSQTKAFSEIFGGVHQYLYIQDLCRNLSEAKLENIAANLKKIYESLYFNTNFKFACVNTKEVCELARMHLRASYAKFPHKSAVGFESLREHPLRTHINEGWITTTTVAFNAASQKCVTYKHPDAPVLAVIAKLLKSIYLHREIREKGGAYGGLASFSSESGVFSMASYRDPHVAETFAVFDKARHYLTVETFDENDVTDAILQVASDLGKPHTPSAMARLAFMCEVTGLTDANRQAFKQGVLDTNKEKIVNVAAKYFADGNPVNRAAISNREKLQQANAILGANALELHNIQR